MERNFIITDEMVAAAFALRKVELWKSFMEDVFAVKLSNGEIGYCTAEFGIGHDDHCSFYLFVGRKGFNTYLWKLCCKGFGDMPRLVDYCPTTEQKLELLETFNYIEVEFVDTDYVFPYAKCPFTDMYEQTKSYVKDYAVRNRLIIPQEDGIPLFNSHHPGKEAPGIINEEEGKLITVAMLAGVVFEKKLEAHNYSEQELGFEPFKDFASKKGGHVIPLIMPMGDGKYEWTTIKTPAYYQSDDQPLIP